MKHWLSIALGLMLALFAVLAEAQTVPDCTTKIPGLNRVEYSLTTARLEIDRDHSIAARSSSSGGASSTSGSNPMSLELRLAISDAWEVKIESPDGNSSACRLKISDHWVERREVPRLGYQQPTGGTVVVSGNALTAALGGTVERPLSFRHRQSDRAPRRCTDSDTKVMWTDWDLTLGTSIAGDVDLLLSNGSTGPEERCLRVATLSEDKRTLVVAQGNSRWSFDVGSLRDGQLLETAAPYLEEPEGRTCSISLTHKTGSTQFHCNTEFEIPAHEGLRAFRVRHVPMWYRAHVRSPLAAKGPCPVSPPTEAAKVVDVVDGQKLPVCVYHSDNAVQWSLVAKDPDLIEVLACDADVDKCEAVLADNRARFAAPPSKPIIVFGYKSNPRAQYSATKSCPNDGRRCQAFESDPRPFAALQERPEEQVFTWDHDLDETKALCVPAVQKHQRSLPPEAPPGYLTVTADGSPISSPKSWRLENGERFCPVDVPPGEIDRMQAAWRSRKALWVSFLQAGTSIFRREYRKGSDLKISSIGFYHRDPKAGPVHQACYDATRTLFSEGGLLCVTVPDAGQKNAVSIDLDQIVLRDGVGGRILGRFYSSAGSIHGFRRERQASTPLFCTKLSTRESGEIGVRFAPEPDSPRGDVAFSFRDSVMGCTNAHGTAVACGSMDPQFWHLVWGKDAFSLGSVSLGGWFGITGNEEIRYRVVGLVPLVDAGLKVPNVVGGSLQTGVAVPFTLPGSAAAVTRDKPDGSANEESAADALIGVGVGPYLTGCVKLEVGNVPQACIGVSGEVGLERVERADDSQRREGYLQLSWFFAAGTGF